MKFRPMIAMAGIGVLSAVPAVAAGFVTGTLWVRHAAWLAHQRKGNGPDVRDQAGVTDAVVYLDSLPAATDERIAAPRHWFWQRHETPRLPRMVQMGRGFVPRVMSVPVGTRTEFQNLDHEYHNVFSVSPARRFDLGKNAPGRRDTVTFARVGVVNLHCDIHPDELGYVVVTPNHAIARPDSLGRFRLPKLPPGSYALHVFHPHRGELRRRIVVPRHGDLDLELAF